MSELPKCSLCDKDAIGYCHIGGHGIQRLFFVIRVVRFCEDHREEVEYDAKNEMPIDHFIDKYINRMCGQVGDSSCLGH